MKALKMTLILGILLTGVIIANGQPANEWRIVLNNDHSAFTAKVANNEFTFVLNPQTDTLFISHSNKKPMKAGIVIEAALKNNSKVFYTTTEKNLNPDKTVFAIPLADVNAGLKSIKMPSKPKYVLSIKEKTTVREKLNFEFSEK